MKILGISAFYHDSAASVLVDGRIVAAAQEERFTRIKHDPAFPAGAVKFCLDTAGLSVSDLDAVAFYDKPFLKFERLLETYFSNSPAGLPSFLKAMPVWVKEKMFMKKILRDELTKLQPGKFQIPKLVFPEHHLSHAASAFYPSPFEESAILTIDGVGEWATTSLCHGKGKDITILRQLDFPHSPGLLYSAFTYFLGFKVNSGEYKLMGLAPYGGHGGERVKRFKEIILRDLVDLQNDGSLFLHPEQFTYATGLRMVNDEKWSQLFGVKKREAEAPITQAHCDLALAIQEVTEEIVLRMAREVKRLTNSENLCMAGGVALNCMANGKLSAEKIFRNIFIQPAAGDAGGSLGAAYAAQHIYFGKERTVSSTEADQLEGSYLGPRYSDIDIEKVIRKFSAKATRYIDENDLVSAVARVITGGKVTGWFNGRMEFGPRALGNRSILADPRSPEMQKTLNLRIKFREGFRPFAPAVLEEDVDLFFEPGHASPYMLFISKVKSAHLKPLPENYEQLEMMERLYVQRSAFPSITHVDLSARIQTVSKRTNPRFHALLSEIKKLTGSGMLVNTSFNVRNEPIVNTPEEAFTCFMRTKMDVLVLNEYVFLKEEQTPWAEDESWKTQFKTD